MACCGLAPLSPAANAAEEAVVEEVTVVDKAEAKAADAPAKVEAEQMASTEELEDPELKAMREELERLQLEQQLADARLQKDLRIINEESQRLAAQQAPRCGPSGTASGRVTSTSCPSSGRVGSGRGATASGAS